MDAREPLFEAIVAAAGAGRRFGSPKLLARLGEGTVLDAVLKTAFAAPVRTVRLVVGCKAEEVAAAARATAAVVGATARLRLLSAPDWRDGLSASLRAGFSDLPPDADAAFLLLGDMPRIPPGMAFDLAAALTPGKRAAAPLYAGRRGHPVLVGRSLFAEMSGLNGDQGGKRLLDGLGPALALVDTADSGVLLDVDTPEDLVRLAGRTP